MELLTEHLTQVMQTLLATQTLDERHVLVFGVSTSEVAGKPIGSEGSQEIAATLFAGIRSIQQEQGFHLAFQCCEHLNRACVVERKTAERFAWDEVTVIPVRHAGGAMASYAFHHLDEAVCVETIRADAAIDIGDTLIGMHMKPVAVPLRSEQKKIGAAHVTMAYTRPKRIGGARAVYPDS